MCQYIMCIPARNSHIDQICHDQWHDQVKACFQHLKQRRKYTFFFVFFQIRYQIFHVLILLLSRNCSIQLPAFYIL